MQFRKNLQQIIEHIQTDEQYSNNIVNWHTIPERESQTVPFPDSIDSRLKQALQNRGIKELYTHQGQAYEITRKSENFVAVTPTASGKTLCYNLPVLQQIIDDPSSRALYIFPTKALAQDQKSELNELIEALGININSYTYDGDTPSNIRQKVRQAGHIIITNPDMLHSAILPHHTKWVALFENLKFIVIDELHIYRGVFGSHVANVIRRLKRICAFYGSNPIFICTSATIANPKELAERLTGEIVTLIDKNGAPAGKKHFVFYNPPVVNKPLNIRRSATLEVRKIASEFLKNKIQTIVFARSRVRVEILLTYLQGLVQKELGPKSIRGYRGGYLPKQRREIEQGLRNGDIYGVVSTNALELGVDIGQLQVCIMTGYPGTIASAWQQAGRAGRRQGEALIFMVASQAPLDQYVIGHPDYFFNRSPETARINPDNLIILVDHLKCAAYELPFKKGDTFDGVELEDILEFLTEEQVLHFNNGKWFWMNQSFPAHNISLRSASQENVVIIDQSDVAHVKVIGEMDRFSAMTLLHDEAIYLHEGVQFQVEKLDWEEKKAFVREVDVDYYTDANLAVQLRVLEVDKERETEFATVSYGEVTVQAMATVFKKIKFDTHENIGSGPIHLPEEELHTNAAWISLNEGIKNKLTDKKLEEGLIGIANLLRHVAPLHVMCDPSDLHVVPQVKAVHSEKPTIFLYDRYPGGVGLSEKVYEIMEELLAEAEQIISHCGCESGCPSCVGMEATGEDGKQLSLKLIELFRDGQKRMLL
ncbi:helicase family protein with metal-binding cysteine cluster [Schinkia azotoformans MEV2011]|uniref:Helicase family protein with metal-binding cysteine cluster n=1 Tax=Schinkia azotoformans MEV2011 TaxID=1348973 RepID=A0A072NH84_SCHAZ|nr:DEAD/DEAH box helicase [Schinkia azotoformans]KEF37054.1 helicase family protein with metal-binding cysteine cluster [Schinkia azotoformans MEV2011]MEC1697677.1 DEAD/DEAH box helicase [Schinkia azotoformans]MEC1718582.1 DEAD/DEAH box helicase [Schinkia azotoformans]MEC1727465.1 DEAD/DEAH box helicase [Schinkia azotoformans]MEC1746291.1 DEAD/DEAH box helicase [Schinkia azotoformans]